MKKGLRIKATMNLVISSIFFFSCTLCLIESSEKVGDLSNIRLTNVEGDRLRQNSYYSLNAFRNFDPTYFSKGADMKYDPIKSMAMVNNYDPNKDMLNLNNQKSFIPNSNNAKAFHLNQFAFQYVTPSASGQQWNGDWPDSKINTIQQNNGQKYYGESSFGNTAMAPDTNKQSNKDTGWPAKVNQDWNGAWSNKGSTDFSSKAKDSWNAALNSEKWPGTKSTAATLIKEKDGTTQEHTGEILQGLLQLLQKLAEWQNTGTHW